MSPTPPRPAHLDLLPADLVERRQWLCWRYEPRGDGKFTKVPINPATRRRARFTTPSNWSDAPATLIAADAHDLGLGFVLTGDDPIAGIDLDDCREPESGLIAAWALDILEEIETYTECSPSGTGLHLFGRGIVGSGQKIRDGERRLELYDRDRFFTVTGQALKDTPGTLGVLQPLIDRLIAAAPTPVELGPIAVDRNRFPLIHDDEEVLHRARNATNGDSFARHT